MRHCRISTGWVWSSGAFWRASVIQEEPQSEERWNVHIYCALRTPPYFAGYDRAYLLHAGGEPYSAPLAASIHRAKRWYWQAALGRGLRYGPDNPQSGFELANGIPAIDDPLLRSGGVAIAGVSEYPDQPDSSEFHATLPVGRDGQRRADSVVRDGDTGEWGVWLASGTPGWLEAGGAPYRAPATVCAHRAERWYWQLVCGRPLRHGDDFPQHWWEQRNQIPDLDGHHFSTSGRQLGVYPPNDNKDGRHQHRCPLELPRRRLRSRAVLKTSSSSSTWRPSLVTLDLIGLCRIELKSITPMRYGGVVAAVLGCQA